MIRTKQRITTLLLAAALLLLAASCQTAKPAGREYQDREGNSIILSQSIDRIISLGPSNTEILVALGAGSSIIAVDDYSENIEGIPDGIPAFSMLTPDGEQILGMQPDIIFVTGMSMAGGDDPFRTVRDAGICIIYIPSSENIENIKEDIRYMADVLGVKEKGDSVIAQMEQEIDTIKKIGETITDRKTVYFEISAAPYMYSFGNGVFLNEMLELIGAENILNGQESWLAVADESVVKANPDVILTSVDYIEDPIGEIQSRAGWDAITAVKHGDVHYIDTNASNRPSQNIVKALKEMAKAIYPDKY